MKKTFMTAILAGLMAVSMSMTAFAGQWQQDAKGWWYQNDDKTYLKDGWKWVDGKCYYFTSDGYCLTGTQTPDGYTVDASGAWIDPGRWAPARTDRPRRSRCPSSPSCSWDCARP